MNKEEKQYLQDWLTKAGDDYRAARLLLNNELPLTAPACFHCQQAVEKYFKAYLIVQKIDFPKTHDVDHLLKLCNNSNPTIFNEIQLFELAEFGVDIRYPGEIETPTLAEAQQYFEIAKQIKQIVEPIVKKTLENE